MTDIPMITMWMGKNVDELTREEAIDALKQSARMLAEAQQSTARAWKFSTEILQRNRRQTFDHGTRR